MIANAALRAAVGNAVSQGIAAATGLQSSFNWRGVAAGAAGGAAGELVGRVLSAMGTGADVQAADGMWKNVQEIAQASLRGFAARLTTAATRGGRVSVTQVAVNAFGNALGSSLASASTSSSQAQPAGAVFNWDDADMDAGAHVAAAQAMDGANNRTLLNAANMAADPSYYSSPTPEQSQAMFRQSERDYRSATERSVAGSGHVAQSDDSISRLLGTSKPQAIGNFMRANGLTSSTIVAGHNYFVPDDTSAYGDRAALGQAVLNGDNKRLAALARERFNFSDGRDANDIRLSFGYQSQVSRQLSGLAGTQGSRSLAGGYGSGGYGEARALSSTEGFFTFDPTGRFLSGLGNSAADIVKLPYTLSKEAVFTVGDAVGNATYGAMNWALGGNQSYQNDSALFRSVEANGVLGAVGNGITGTVRSLPGIAQVDALYHNDMYALGGSVPSTALALGGARLYGDLGNVRLAQADQVRWGYLADDWSTTSLPAGTRVYGGLPGQSAYYTTASTVEAAAGSRTTLFQMLQVEPHPEFGYRPAPGEYEVVTDLRVPSGTAQANVGKGIGGGEQFFIKGYSSSLQLIRKVPLGQ